MFIKKLINDSVSVSNHTKGKDTGSDYKCITITADDIKQCIQQNSSEYDFLQDIVDSKSHDTSTHCQNESEKNVNSIPNYSKIQAQIDKLTNNKEKSNQNDNTNDSQNNVEMTKKRRNKTNNNIDTEGKKQNNKKSKTISSFIQDDNIDDIDTYLQSQDLQTNDNNVHRFGNDQIIEDDEDYDF